MLVLSRKKEERIVIEINGQLIVLQVVGLNPGTARLGIDAPQNAQIYREEIMPDELRPQLARIKQPTVVTQKG